MQCKELTIVIQNQDNLSGNILLIKWSTGGGGVKVSSSIYLVCCTPTQHIAWITDPNEQ